MYISSSFSLILYGAYINVKWRRQVLNAATIPCIPLFVLASLHNTRVIVLYLERLGLFGCSFLPEFIHPSESRTSPYTRPWDLGCHLACAKPAHSPRCFHSCINLIASNICILHGIPLVFSLISAIGIYLADQMQIMRWFVVRAAF